MELFLPDSAATEKLGNVLGKLARSGDVFCFTGDLGAGKTLMSRGIAVGLGAESEAVNSPTFTIMNIYHILSSIFIYIVVIGNIKFICIV